MTTLTLRDAVEVVLEGYTLHEGARKILETAIAQELASQSANTNPVVSQKTAGTIDKTVRNCSNCRNNIGGICGFITCTNHFEAESYWEPKL